MTFRFAAASFYMAALLLPPAAMAATPAENLDQVEARAEFERIIAGFEAEILAPGPMVAGWNAQGVDVEADVAARPGGKAGNYLLEVDKDGERSLTIFSPETPTSVIPANWTKLSEIGDFHRAGEFDLFAARIDGPYFFVLRGASERNGQATCTRGPIQARLYEDPSIEEESELDAAILEMVFQSLVRRFSDHVICSSYSSEAAGYRTRYFLPDGRSLPKMDAFEEKVVIIPSGDIADLLLNRR